MSSPLDVDLHDDELTREIQLLTEMMLLACESKGQLDVETIDGALGITRP